MSLGWLAGQPTRNFNHQINFTSHQTPDGAALELVASPRPSVDPTAPLPGLMHNRPSFAFAEISCSGNMETHTPLPALNVERSSTCLGHMRTSMESGHDEQGSLTVEGKPPVCIGPASDPRTVTDITCLHTETHDSWGANLHVVDAPPWREVARYTEQTLAAAPIWLFLGQQTHLQSVCRVRTE